MSLEEFHAAAQKRQCGVSRVLDELRAHEQAERVVDLTDALEDRTIGPTAIARVVKNWHYDLTERVVRLHRAGDCGCRKAQ